MASEELKTFLGSVNIGYLKYADVIHKGEFTSQAELGAADRTDLQDLKIPKGAAGLIIAAARGAGDFEVRERLSRVEEFIQHTGKRHKTGFTETPLHLADEGVMWQQEVQDKAACKTAKADEMLQPRQPLLAGLRYLSLLYEGRNQDAKGIVAMKRGCKKGEADLEREYYPHMLKIFQAAAAGQPEVHFQLEDPAAADTARPDLRCFVNGVESHPGEAKARNVSSNPITDPDGIHNNKEAFGKLHKVIRAKFLRPGCDQVFFCPCIVCIECCWIAKFEYGWNSDTRTHRLRSSCVCPPIPAKEMPAYGVLCKQLDDVLMYYRASDSVSLTDMLLMAGDASPTPGFLMLVQYVATLCHLHSIAIVQLQFRLYNQQTLDVSQAHVLAYGHKSLVVQLGVEDAVYKIAHHKLVENEIMIHHKVDATVPYVVKSNPEVFGSVEGAGVGWSFLKLQHLGSSLQAVPLKMLSHYWSCAHQAVTGLHMAGVLHRDVKPDNMLIINGDLFLNDFDVSCLAGTSEATLRSRVGTEDFRSPLWQAGKRYRAVDDLASLVLSFAWLLNMRTESPIERVRWVAKLPNAPESMIKTADDILRMFQDESGRALFV